ncbi:hypothetical protein BDQ17DRAFT_1352996 [Cyathus striatus]|nr:hypothetical protein BDQ17DRAFT_1352996 [Cyathus striatus]
MLELEDSPSSQIIDVANKRQIFAVSDEDYAPDESDHAFSVISISSQSYDECQPTPAEEHEEYASTESAQQSSTVSIPSQKGKPTITDDKKPRLRKTAVLNQQLGVIHCRPPNHANTSTVWPAHAPLVLSSTGKILGLRNQQESIRFLLEETLKFETIKLLKDDGWPEFQHRDAFLQDVITAGVKRNSSVRGMSDIKRRLERDPDFCTKLSNLATHRIPLIRKPIKTNAAAQISIYELGIGKKYQERVTSLLENGGLYFFSGKWSNGSTWVLKPDEPYLNPAISETLKNSFFSYPASIGHEVVTKYNKEIDKMDEPELLIAMVALGATAVFASLWEWKDGIKTTKHFDGSLIVETYRDHVETIEVMQKESPNGFHAIHA